MKKKLLERMFAIAVATVLVLGSNGLTAFADDDGTAADAPQGGGGTKESSGAAVAGWDTTDDDQTTFNVTGDDDATANGGTDGETDISIWAKVVEHGDLVYKVDISWGAMKFEFNNQAGKWNTETHTYDTVGGVSQEWTVKGYIDEINNLITVENHSNGAVDASFTYTHDTTNKFNDDYNTNANAVRGHFFLTNADAITASKVLEGSATVANALTDELMLGHQDKSNATNYGGAEAGQTITGVTVPAVTANTTGSCIRKVYFTFNGTPDVEYMGAEIKSNFTKVGVITVTIEPTSNTP